MTNDDKASRPALTAEDLLAICLERGQASLRAGQAEEACASLEEALTLARERDDAAGEASALGLLAQACLRLDRRDEAERHARAGHQIAQALRDDEAAAQLERLVATARSSPEAIELNTTFGDGRAAFEDDDAGRAAALLGRAVDLAREQGHGIAEAAALHLLARAKAELGERDEAARLAGQALDLARQQGDERAVALCEELVGRLAEGESGEGSDGEDDRGHGRPAPRPSPAPLPEPAFEGEPCTGRDPTPGSLAADLQAGQTALAEGDVDRGVGLLEEVRARAGAEGQKVPEAAASALLAQAYIEKERFGEARERALEAAAIAEGLGETEAAAEFRILADMAGASLEAHGMAKVIHQGATALEGGRPEEALRPLEAGIASARAERNEVAEALASGLAARALLALGRKAEARPLAARCLEIARRRGETDSEAHFEALCAAIDEES